MFVHILEPTLSHILSAVLWAAVLGLLIRFTAVFGRDRMQRAAFGGLFALKLLAGVGVWAVYTYYYTDKTTSDIYRFFADAEVVYHTLFESPRHFLHLMTGLGGSTEELQPYVNTMNNWYKSFDEGFVNENRTLIRANALLMPLTFGSYFGNLVWICFLGTWAQAFLYRQLLPRVQGLGIWLFILLNLWPGELFWTSALMKEPLVMMGLALSLGAALKLKRNFSWGTLLLLFAGLWLTLLSKFYVGVALLFPLNAFLFLPETASAKRMLATYSTALLLLLGGVWGLGKLLPGYDIPTIVAYKQRAFANVAQATGAGSAFYIRPLEPSLWDMLRLAPTGIVNSLFRPFPQDARGAMEWAAVAENLLFIAVVLGLLWRARRGQTHVSLAVALLLFGLVILVLGGITVNISGALVRYKMPVIPYLSLGLFLLSQRRGSSAKPV